MKVRYSLLTVEDYKQFLIVKKLIIRPPAARNFIK